MTTLARLSFQVPVARLDDFAALYDQRLARLLAPHGLGATERTGRRPAAGVFSRLLAVDRPGVIGPQRQALLQDPAWEAALQAVRQRLGSLAPDRRLPWALEPYEAPAGPGRSATLGPGLRQGLWQSFGVDDGLPLRDITEVCQDRQENLWVASQGEGVCRSDGALTTTYTVADGLADDRVWSLAEDLQGGLWCDQQGALARHGLDQRAIGLRVPRVAAERHSRAVRCPDGLNEHCHPASLRIQRELAAVQQRRVRPQGGPHGLHRVEDRADALRADSEP